MHTAHQDILLYLCDGKELTFPSLGSLLLLKKGESEMQLSFSRGGSIDYLEQIRYFSGIWGISQVKVNRFFLKLSDEIYRKCIDEDIFSLPHIGRFILTDDKIQFSSYYFVEQNIVLPSTQTFNRAKKEEIKEVINSTSEKDQIKISDNQSNYISRPLFSKNIAGFLLAFIILFIATIGIIQYTNSNRFPTNFNFKDSGYSPSDFNKAPVIKDFPSEEEKKNNNYIKIDKLDSKSSFKEQLTTKDKNNNCIYVLGSFRNEQNIRNLEEKVENIGEQIFKTEISGLTRIGVTIPCDATIRYEKLRSISPEMWLLIE